MIINEDCTNVQYAAAGGKFHCVRERYSSSMAQAELNQLDGF
jgi:hypothetical protein